MFSGIVANNFPVFSFDRQRSVLAISVGPKVEQLILGESIAINGVCLTLSSLKGSVAYFDLLPETLKITNLADLKKDSLVNWERSLKYGDSVGGHLISGHIDKTIKLLKIVKKKDIHLLHWSVSPSDFAFLPSKGSVSLNGVSLTIMEINLSRCFFVTGIIPHTWAMTNLSSLRPGHKVNLEFDSIIKGVVNYLSFKKQNGL